VRTSAFALSCGIGVLAATLAFAQGEPPSPTLPPDAHIDFSPKPPQPQIRGSGPEPTNQEETVPPPPRPGHKGLVLESTLGVLGFAGQFRHVAPPAYWMHAQLGYEPLAWLMLFGEAELAFTDTSESQGAFSRAFHLWGFGGGARAGLHVGEFGMFVQGDLGALSAYVPHDALGNLGFRGAESLGAQFGGRAGVEWYQRDRHLAFTAQAGGRFAQGFSKSSAVSDVPLMWDAAVGLRYTF
jgi:hypothetical protein